MNTSWSMHSDEVDALQAQIADAISDFQDRTTVRVNRLVLSRSDVTGKLLMELEVDDSGNA